MKRIDKDTYFLDMAELISRRGTCSRRRVGCVITNSRNHVLATGYNGVPSGFKHCNADNLCPGAKADSGKDLDSCYATHAEINALVQCKDTLDIHTVYCTDFPCIQCIKAILNTSCKQIRTSKIYANTNDIISWMTLNGRVLEAEVNNELGVRVWLKNLST